MNIFPVKFRICFLTLKIVQQESFKLSALILTFTSCPCFYSNISHSFFWSCFIFTDDLITAKASAKTAEFTSDIELSGRSKRIIKPVQRYNFDGSSEDDEASNSINNRKRQKKQEKPALPFHPLPQAPAIYASSRVPVDLVKQSPSDFISPSKASPTLNTNENNNFNSTHDQRTSGNFLCFISYCESFIFLQSCSTYASYLFPTKLIKMLLTLRSEVSKNFSLFPRMENFKRGSEVCLWPLIAEI